MDGILELIDRKKVNKAMSELEGKLNTLKQFKDKQDLSSVTIEIVYHNKDTYRGQYYPEENYDMKCEFPYNDNWRNTLTAFNKMLHEYTWGYFVRFRIKIGGIIIYETDKKNEFKKIMDMAYTEDTSTILGLIDDYIGINKKIGKCKSGIRYDREKLTSLLKLKEEYQDKKTIEEYKQDLEKSEKELEEYEDRISEIKEKLTEYGINIDEVKEAIQDADG